jgi:TDG/mug DNA glycosylase family protein
VRPVKGGSAGRLKSPPEHGGGFPLLHDRIGPRVRVLFVGINPGIRSATVGHHFAGYSNRFWKLLWESGLVPERVSWEADVRLPEWGYGITNLVARATPGISDLALREYADGRRRLLAKIGRHAPQVVALVGVTLYRALFPQARGPAIGMRPETLRNARVFVLPNPSGRNANFSYDEMLGAFRALRDYLETGN